MSRLGVEHVNEYITDGFPSLFLDAVRCEELDDGFAVARWSYDETRYAHYGGDLPSPVLTV